MKKGKPCGLSVQRLSAPYEAFLVDACKEYIPERPIWSSASVVPYLPSGASYSPALTIRDVASLGIRERIPEEGRSKPRHLLSKVESSWYRVFRWNQRVLEIREQVPLRPWRLIASVAEEIGVAPPQGFDDQRPWTTDLLLTVRDEAGVYFAAISCKRAKALKDPRTLEKLETERLFWRAVGLPWGLATEEQLPKGLLRNLRWLQSSMRRNSFMPHEPQKRQGFLGTLYAAFRALPGTPIVATCRAHDMRYASTAGVSMSGLRYALAHRLWPATLAYAINPLEPPVFLLDR